MLGAEAWVQGNSTVEGSWWRRRQEDRSHLLWLLFTAPPRFCTIHNFHVFNKIIDKNVEQDQTMD
jgi:hypothetical protein